MLEEIKKELGAYYSEEDEELLVSILDEVTANAFTLSNNNTVEQLKPEIKLCVKSMYLRRGTEHNSSLNANGESTNYIDPIEEMRNNIIKNGKRRAF